MDETLNYAEYTVALKAEGKNMKKRILLIALYALILVGIVVFFALLPGFAVVGGVLFVLLIAVIFFTWRLVKEENKFEVSNAKLKVTHITGSGKQNVLFENFVSGFSLIAPMNDEYKAEHEKADETLDFRSSKQSVDSYFAVLEKDGKRTVVCFEAVNKMLKVMKFYNRNTVVTEMRY